MTDEGSIVTYQNDAHEIMEWRSHYTYQNNVHELEVELLSGDQTTGMADEVIDVEQLVFRDSEGGEDN